jgi:hypothetical protein
LSRDSQNSHWCDRFRRFGSISVPKIRSTPNSKWSSLLIRSKVICNLLTKWTYYLMNKILIWTSLDKNFIIA